MRLPPPVDGIRIRCILHYQPFTGVHPIVLIKSGYPSCTRIVSSSDSSSAWVSSTQCLGEDEQGASGSSGSREKVPWPWPWDDAGQLTVGQGKCWGNHGTTFVWNPVGTNYVAESRAEGSNLLVSHRRKEGTHNMYILYVCIHIYIYTYTYTYAYAHNMMQQSFWVFRHLPSILGVIPRLLSTIGNRTTGWGDFPASPGRTTYPVVLCLHPIMSLLFAQICHIYHHFLVETCWNHKGVPLA